MAFETPKCRITVVKRTINRDLIDEYLDEDTSKTFGPCDRFVDGQEFIVDGYSAEVPEGFCAWAWADIRRDILSVAAGADMPGMKQKGIVITGCTDWFRPVIFKVERID